MMTPTMLWTHITMMAKAHWLEVALPPYPMVCWVSTLNRKAVVKSSMLSTQTTWSGWVSRYSGSRSRWTTATRNQTTPNRSQERKNEAENQKMVHHQESSIRLVKKSLRNLGCDDHLFQSFLIVLKHRPVGFRLINISNIGVNSPMLWHNSVSLGLSMNHVQDARFFSEGIPRRDWLCCHGSPEEVCHPVSHHRVISAIIPTWPMLKAINCHASLDLWPQYLTEIPLSPSEGSCCLERMSRSTWVREVSLLGYGFLSSTGLTSSPSLSMAKPFEEGMSYTMLALRLILTPITK